MKKKKEKKIFLIKKNNNNSKNISRNFSGAVAGSMGSVQSLFELTLLNISRPLPVVGVNCRDFNLLHLSLLKQFPLFIWLLFAGLFSV